MADTSIELIKELRERTGAGLMDCKHALQANDNDIQKSVDWLREKGIAKQASKASRIAAEGLTALKIEGDKAALVEINCETDFVARADPFKDLVKKIGDMAFEAGTEDTEALKAVKGADGKTVADLFTDAGLKLGEKLSLRRIAIIKKNPDQLFGSYVHMGGSMTIVAVVKGGDAAFADEVAMCIASDNPTYLSINEIPAEELAKEKAVQVETAKNDPTFGKKPAAIQDKIIEGRVEKHFQEEVFAFQEYVLDSTKKMDQVLKEHKAEVVSFVRYKVGEGMEKRHEDFAAEVAAQAKA